MDIEQVHVTALTRAVELLVGEKEAFKASVRGFNKGKRRAAATGVNAFVRAKYQRQCIIEELLIELARPFQ